MSNNWAGTADLVDPHTFKRLKRIDVDPRPRGAHRRDPGRSRRATFYFDSIRTLVGEGHDQYVDDGFTSPDGRVVYFSRPSFADVVAIDLRTGHDPLAHAGRRLPRRPHGAVADGRRLLVSASTGERRRRASTRATGAIVGTHPVGPLPAREQLLARRPADLPREHRHRLHRHRRPVARTRRRASACSRSIDARDPAGARSDRHGRRSSPTPAIPSMSSAVRPMAITPGRALRLLPGLLLLRDRPVRPARRTAWCASLDLPLGAARGLDAHRLPARLGAPRSGHESAAGRKLCVAGTMSGYAAIVTRQTVPLQRVDPASGACPTGRHTSERRALLLRVRRRRRPRRR